MNPLIIIGLLVGIPIVLGLLLRVSALLMFLSLTIGYMFVEFLGDDAVLATSAFIQGSAGDSYTKLVMLLLPLLVTLLVARKSVPATKTLTNIPFLLMTGLLVGVLALPLLPGTIERKVYATQTGNALRQTQDNIVGLTGLFYLAFIWFTYRTKDHHGKHGKHH